VKSKRNHALVQMAIGVLGPEVIYIQVAKSSRIASRSRVLQFHNAISLEPAIAVYAQTHSLQLEHLVMTVMRSL
jgi:hypothetical protein